MHMGCVPSGCIKGSEKTDDILFSVDIAVCGVFG